MTTVSNEQNQAENPMNSGDKPRWTAEERLAFRILGRLGYEGDLLRPFEHQTGSYLQLIFDLLVEELNAGVINLGAPGLSLDKTVSAAESYCLGHRKAGAE